MTPARVVLSRAFAFATVGAATATLTACDPCSGTHACHLWPNVSYVGQFVEWPSGKSVGGVHIAFVSTGGVSMVSDTIRAVADADGYFTLRGDAMESGVAEGTLIVTPPAPRPPYSVRGIRLSTTRTRGDGGSFGRLMVNPYLQLIAEVRDRVSLGPRPLSYMSIKSLGPAVISPDTHYALAADNGRVEWTPTVVTPGDLVLDFEIETEGYPRKYRFQDTVPLQYRAEPPLLKAVAVGGGWAWVGEVVRRGTKTHPPGVSVTFTRTGGIAASANQFTAIPDSKGRFDIPLEPVGDGTLVGDLVITPPAPLPVDTVRNIEIKTFDGFGLRLLGPYAYGPATILRPVFVYRATGLPVQRKTWVRFKHVGGLPDVIPAPWGVNPDDGIRIIDSTGTAKYDAGTAVAGTVLYDMEVMLNYPHKWDTLKAVPVPATFSDSSVIDTMRVGSWFPWGGVVRDAGTDAAINNLNVEFRRTAGARVKPDTFTVKSAADGAFLIRPAPVDSGFVDGVLRFIGGGVYRDSTISVRLFPRQDDSTRSVGTIRLTRLP